MNKNESNRKGMILVAGRATRLFPITEVVPKSMLPIYDKPMIYYPLYILMQAKIRDIMILVSPLNKKIFMDELGNGSRFGVKITYVVQNEPKGIADAFILGENFIGKSNVMMMLGDNVLYSPNPMYMQKIWEKADRVRDKATIFGYPVLKPKNFGVVDMDKNGNALSLEEKPEKPKSNLAVPGIYFYPNDVIEKAKSIKPSARGELEITDVNKLYLNEGRLKVEKLDKIKWFDTGTFESLYQTIDFIRSKTEHNSRSICCPEEIALQNHWITKKQVLKIAEKYNKCYYGEYLKKISDEYK